MSEARPDASLGSWHRRATRPITYWLLAVPLAAALHPWLPAATWVLVHAFTLGLLANSILVWGQHFVETLAHVHPDDAARRIQVRRMQVLNLGIVVLMVGMLAGWPPAVVTGGVVVGGAVTWYAVDVARQLRGAAPGRFRRVVWFYPVAAAFLPLGATMGVWLGAFSSVGAGDASYRLLTAHLAANVLGFVGITVFTTLVTFWATVLRTPMAPQQDRIAVPALALMAVAVLGAVAAAGFGSDRGVAAALALWLTAVLAQCVSFVRCAVHRPPREFAPLSMGCGLLWLLGAMTWTTWLFAVGRGGDLQLVTVPLLAGFGGQMLFGAMSFLMPTVMRGGPAAVRAGMTAMNRLAVFRLVLVQVGLGLYLVGRSQAEGLRIAGAVCVAVGYLAFVPIMILAVKAQVGVIRATATARTEGTPRPVADRSVPIGPDRRQAVRGAAAAVAVLALVAGLAVVVDPDSPLRRNGAVSATGHTTTVTVTARGMRFEPDEVRVPAGDRLVIELVNADSGQVHDLELAGGESTGSVDPGGRASLEVGMVTRSVDGWCSIAGHRAMGMTFRVRSEGGEQGSPGGSGSTSGDVAGSSGSGHAGHDGAASSGSVGSSGSSGSAAPVDVMSPPSAGYVTRDPVLAPAPAGRLHRVTLTVQETRAEIAPGLVRPVWTYNGRLGGPPLRGHVGDTFEVTLVNGGSMGHSVDFHAGDVRPNEVMRMLAPGERLVYRFTARRSGIWLYHCGAMPMTGHLSAGMFGAVVIDPPGLEPVDSEFLLMQSEAYPAADGGPFDSARIRERQPDVVMFNGHATQYLRDPLRSRRGQRVRIWVLDAGPSDGTSFHVVGGQFDTVYKEGAYTLRRGGDDGTGGAQALDLGPAQGGFVEMVPPEPGRYTFLDHGFADAEKGARGYLDVS